MLNKVQLAVILQALIVLRHSLSTILPRILCFNYARFNAQSQLIKDIVYKMFKNRIS